MTKLRTVWFCGVLVVVANSVCSCSADVPRSGAVDAAVVDLDSSHQDGADIDPSGDGVVDGLMQDDRREAGAPDNDADWLDIGGEVIEDGCLELSCDWTSLSFQEWWMFPEPTWHLERTIDAENRRVICVYNDSTSTVAPDDEAWASLIASFHSDWFCSALICGKPCMDTISLDASFQIEAKIGETTIRRFQGSCFPAADVTDRTKPAYWIHWLDSRCCSGDECDPVEDKESDQ